MVHSMSITQQIAILLPILVISVSIHEAMHALSSYLLGDDTAARQGRISLNPLVHIDPFLSVLLPILTLIATGQIFAIAKPVEVNFLRLKWEEFGGAIVAVAGPLSNALICLIAAGIYHLLQPTIGSLEANILSLFVELNLVLALINMIPWPPLDGSRILYAFAPRPLQELMVAIERGGLTSLLVLFFIFYTFAGNWVFTGVTSLMVTLGVPMPVI